MGSENNKPLNTLARLDDVYCADPAVGDMLVWDASQMKFVVKAQRQVLFFADADALTAFGNAEFKGQMAVVLVGPVLKVGKADLTWLALT
jgi:hypothetical protein